MWCDLLSSTHSWCTFSFPSSYTCDHEKKNCNVPLHSTPTFNKRYRIIKGGDGNFFNIKKNSSQTCRQIVIFVNINVSKPPISTFGLAWQRFRFRFQQRLVAWQHEKVKWILLQQILVVFKYLMRMMWIDWNFGFLFTLSNEEFYQTSELEKVTWPFDWIWLVSVMSRTDIWLVVKLRVRTNSELLEQKIEIIAKKRQSSGVTFWPRPWRCCVYGRR